MERQLEDERSLLIIAGPTGVGKSALALRLARQTGAGILSADSMQVYRGMEIGTAQPTREERDSVPHFLVGHVEPGEEYHVARFVAEAEEAISREHAEGRKVIVCGGTGLFLRHLLQGIMEGAPRSPEVRARLEAELQEHGYNHLRARLRAVDPKRESEINPNDAVRVIRALEVYEVTGVPMSELHAQDTATRRLRPHRYVVLHRPRDIMMDRINQRVDAMMDAGWLEEARELLARRLPDDSQACKALGYRELFAHLREQSTLEAAIEQIKLLTRRFAKRQLTWFRAVENAEWINLESEITEKRLDDWARFIVS